MRYQKLPKNTKPTTVAGVLFIGGCLGYGIAIHGFVALYGLSGFLNNYFYPGSNLQLSANEPAYLGAMGLVAAICATKLSFLAFFMNTLSKKALKLSHYVFVPTALVSWMVWYQHNHPEFNNHLSQTWVIATLLTVPVAGLLPLLFLRTNAARKLHNR